VFTPSPATVDSCRRLIAAFRQAEAQGSAAVDFEGQHVDYAHVKTAQGVIDLAESLGLGPEDAVTGGHHARPRT
jgi:citrate lyase subunit beta/citryl-CoA lyase